MNVFKLFGEIVVDDKDANKKIDGVAKTAKGAEGKMGTSFGNIGKSVGKALTLGALVAFEKKVISTYSTYDDQMRVVQAVTGSTGAEFESLRDRAEDLGRTTRFSATEAGEAMEALGRASWSTSDVLDNTGSVLSFATANSIELGQAADMVAKGLNQFGLEAKDTTYFTDVLSQTTRSSGTDVLGLQQSLINTSGMVNIFGYNVEDVSLALGLMGDKALEGGAAGTSLNSAFTHMAKGGKDVDQAMQDLGLSLFDANGNAKPLDVVLQEMRGSFSNLTDEQKAQYASTLFGTAGMKGMMSIIEASDEDFDALADSIANASGTTEEMADIMDGGMGGAIASVESAWEGVLIAFGKFQDGIVVDGLNAVAFALQQLPKVLDVVNQVWGKFTDFLRNHSKELKAFADQFMRGLDALVDFISTAVELIVQIVLITFEGMGAPLLKIWDGILKIIKGTMEVIEGVLNVILGLISGDWDRTWEGIKQIVHGVWEAIKGIVKTAMGLVHTLIKGTMNLIKGVFKTVWGLIKGIFQTVWDAIVAIVEGAINLVLNIIESVLNAIKGIWELVWGAIGDYVKFIWELIKATIENTITVIQTIIQTIMNVIKAFWQTIWNYIGDHVKKVWNSIKQVIESVLNAIKGVVTNVMNAIKGVMQSVWNAIKSTTQSVWNAIKGVIQSVLNAIKGVIQSIMNTIKGIVTNIWNSVKSVTSNVWNSIKSTIDNILNGIKNSVSNVFNGIKNTATNVWNNVKDAMVRPIEAARDAISNALDRIKGFFSGLRLKFPKIEMPKLPKFEMTGSFGLNPPSVPRLSVNWNADGAIFTRPTIFDTPQGMQGVGEAGAEAVLPIEKLSGILAATLRELGFDGETTKGGIVQNLTINSPKHLSPSETARENRKVLQRLGTEV